MTDTTGVLYVATGATYLDEARRSARSLKAADPHRHVTLFTDVPDISDPAFDDVRPVEVARHDFGDKIRPLAHTPYDRTLFLDTDTYVCRPLDDAFRLLDRFELAAAHDTYRVDPDVAHVPDSFPPFNTGVIAYRRTPAVDDLLRAWDDAYSARHAAHRPGDRRWNDQSSFAELVWNSDVRVGVLPSEYNLRLWCPGFLGTRGTAAVLHGHVTGLDDLAARVNRSPHARVVLPSLAYLEPQSTVVATPNGGRLVAITGRVLAALGKRPHRPRLT